MREATESEMSALRLSIGTRRVVAVVVAGLVGGAVMVVAPTSAVAQTEKVSPAQYSETVCSALSPTRDGDEKFAEQFSGGPAANFGPGQQAAIDAVAAYQETWVDAAATLDAVAPDVSGSQKIGTVFVDYANEGVDVIQVAIDEFKTVDPASPQYTAALNSFGYRGGVNVRPALGDPMTKVTNRSVRKAFENEESCDFMFASLVDSPVTEFSVPTASVTPFDITAGPNGNLWFTEYRVKTLGKVDADTGKVTEFPVPGVLNSVAAGPDGNIWFTERDPNQVGPFSSSTVPLKVGKFDPKTKKVTTYPVPTATGNARPTGITAGPDGNLWFGERNTNQMGKIDPKTATVTLYPVPTPNAQPGTSIATGPDGNLWFTEQSANKIGKIDPKTGVITEYPIPTAAASPFHITAGNDGESMWFTEVGANKIAKIDTATGVVTEYTVPSAAGDGLFGIAAGCDGNIWYTQNNTDELGKFDPETGKVIEIPVPTANSQPTSIVSGPDGNLWFVQEISNSAATVDLGKAKNEKKFKGCADPLNS